jgi:D-alanyl-D-alanine dipeptidase
MPMRFPLLAFCAAMGLMALAGEARAQPSAAGLPPGFVYLRDVAPDVRQDMRYAGAHNFIGRPIAGYQAAECVLTARAAQAVGAVQAELSRQGLSLLVWDCYRPARAVRDFLRWTKDPDTRMQGEFYPRVEKGELVTLGYIAARSAHSRGSTLDLGIVPETLASPPSWSGTLTACTAAKGTRFDDGTVDLGTGFDCFDPRAHVGDAGISMVARANRALLRGLMVRHGFAPYEREWWHFRLRSEPFPHRSFDFLIPPRPTTNR